MMHISKEFYMPHFGPERPRERAEPMGWARRTEYAYHYSRNLRVGAR